MTSPFLCFPSLHLVNMSLGPMLSTLPSNFRECMHGSVHSIDSKDMLTRCKGQK